MAQPIAFLLNDRTVHSDLPPATVVLDYLRRERGLTGTKEVCREGDCGACLVLLGERGRAGRAAGAVTYQPVTSCLLPLGEAAGRHLVSIEGLNRPLPARQGRGEDEEALPLNPVQRHLVREGAIQCGFCTPGFVIAITAFLLNAEALDLPAAVQAVAGNICRCTGYASIRRAMAGLLEEYRAACGGPSPAPGAGRIESLVACGVLPPYFREVPARLSRLRVAAKAERGVGTASPAAAARRRVWVAGGTDLFVQRPEELLGEAVAFVSERAGMSGARVRGGELVLGAGTSMEQLKSLPELRRRLPQLLEALEYVASAPIRGRATLGGNIVNASPIGDLTVMLLALGARLGLRSTAPGAPGPRELPLEKLFLGYKRLALRASEIVETVTLPLPPAAGQPYFGFEKVCRRQHLDIASVNCAAWLRVKEDRVLEARLAAGGVAPVPLVLAGASAALAGREPTETAVRQALEAAQEEISPISDVRGSAGYKRLLLRQLLLAQLLRAFPGRLREEAWL